MTYETFSIFAGTWGLILLVIMFSAAMTYAFWPGNKDMFEHAAKLPLDDEERSEKEENRS